MAECIHENNIYNKVDNFMSIFRLVLDKLFIKKDNNINAKLVLTQLKRREVDINAIEAFFKDLPEGEWNIKTFLVNLPKLNEIFGVSDVEIENICVNEVSKKDIQDIRYTIIVDSMLDYSKFSTEFYDALKYNKTGGLSISKIKLLNEIMLTFKFINDKSKQIYEFFKNKQHNPQNLKKMNIERLPIEFLMLRILYISINLNNATDRKLADFAQLLGKERISISYQKVFSKK